MNVTPWTIYWITRLDAISMIGAVLLVVGMISGALTTAFYLVAMFNQDDGAISLRPAVRTLWAVAAAGAVIGMFVPDSKEAAAIVLVPKMANSETVQNMNEGLKLLTEKWLVDLKEGLEDDTEEKKE